MMLPIPFTMMSSSDIFLHSSSSDQPVPSSDQSGSPAGKSAGGDTPLVQAVIFLGASAVSMMVTEEHGRTLRVLDVLSQPVELGHDIFHSGVISRETMERCVHIVQGYNRLLGEYREGGEVHVRLLASNVLLDVHNMDTIINRLQLTCGMRLEVLDDGEMTRLLYLRMRAMLARHADLERERVLVLHVGPGNTRLILFDKGRITYYASYRMGACRTCEAISGTDYDGADDECSLIRKHIQGVVEQIRHDAEEALPAAPDALVVFGPDFHRVDSPLLDGTPVAMDALATLAEEIAHTPPSQRMERYREDYASVGSLLPSVLTYLALAREFEPGALLFPREEFSQAFLLHLLPSRRNDAALEQEVIHFSLLLANRYRVDRGHSQQVRRLSSMLFDQLQEMHGLSRHDRLLLKVAAILHEVGTFISPKNHHRHGQYIILNSEIFGLSRQDVEIIGLLARYHRHGVPTTDERSYAEMDLPNRLRVQKLAALLRVADAMERAHSRRIHHFTIRRNNRRLELLVPGLHDLAIENMALRSKGDLFTDIFGYDLQLLPEAT